MVDICVNCGSFGTIKEIQRRSKTAISCCPEREVYKVDSKVADYIKYLKTEIKKQKNCCNCGNQWLRVDRGVECNIAKHKHDCDPLLKPQFFCEDWKPIFKVVE